MLGLQKPRQPKRTTDQEACFFTFWDMDDTSVELQQFKIKNPHFLLPILLFQTHAANQHFGIMTNRSPAEDEIPEYTVAMFLHELSTFGIEIPQEHVVFGGGENGRPQGESHYSLQQAIEQLNKQLQVLQLVDNDLYQEQKIKISSIESVITEKRFAGKNFLLTQFFNQCYRQAERRYIFETGSCHVDTLHMGIVDDAEVIAESAAQLGARFFGIKASPGGRLPKGADDALLREYYDVSYLKRVAAKIGLHAYAEQVLSAKLVNSDMLTISALLYAWQAYPGSISAKAVKKAILQLNDKEFMSIVYMLEYINQHTDPKCAFRPVQEILESLKPNIDQKFLDTVLEHCALIDRKIADLEQTGVKVENAPAANDGSKTKGLLLFKKGSQRSQSAASFSIKYSTEAERQLKFLRLCKEKVIVRISGLTGSTTKELASLAQSKFLAITSNSSEISLHNASASASTSSSPSQSGQTSAAITPPTSDVTTTLELRRSFTPAASSGRDTLKSSASDNDLARVEQEAEKQKKKKTSTRNGSFIK
ncbi:MAG: hypothetical protein JSR17_13730 [Proteobacteria bacterium]|nr:hypothetical protein [Pseudomonadota bacterium]